MKRFLIRFLIQVLLSQVNSQAPGDADPFCLSLSGSVTPPSYPSNSKILMDSYQYLNLLPPLPETSTVWQQVDVDNRTDLPGGTDWFQVSSFACRQKLSSCFFSTGDPENWLISQHISRLVNGTLLPQVCVQIEFKITGCSSGCQISFQLNVWETSDIDKDAARIISNYRRIATVAPTMEVSNISQNASIHINFTSPNATGFYVAIVDENTCITLTRVIVLYHVCPEMVLDLIRYPETLSPPIINEVQSHFVDGQCVDNASGELQGQNPRLSCIQGGKWMLEGTGCQCDPGFMHREETEECTPCPMGEYVSPSNLTCQPCPSNTREDMAGVAECECLPGYFRAADENADFGCTYQNIDETIPPTLSNESDGTLHDGIVATIVVVIIITLVVICISGAIFTLLVIRQKNNSVLEAQDSFSHAAIKGIENTLTTEDADLHLHTIGTTSNVAYHTKLGEDNIETHRNISYEMVANNRSNETDSYDYI